MNNIANSKTASLTNLFEFGPKSQQPSHGLFTIGSSRLQTPLFLVLTKLVSYPQVSIPGSNYCSKALQQPLQIESQITIKCCPRKNQLEYFIGIKKISVFLA